MRGTIAVETGISDADLGDSYVAGLVTYYVPNGEEVVGYGVDLSRFIGMDLRFVKSFYGFSAEEAMDHCEDWIALRER